MSYLTKVNLIKTQHAMKRFLKDESGDTNFISIIIILGIVIVLVGVFVGFKDQILGVIREIVGGFSAESLGDAGGTKPGG